MNNLTTIVPRPLRVTFIMASLKKAKNVFHIYINGKYIYILLLFLFFFGNICTGNIRYPLLTIHSQINGHHFKVKNS